MPLSELQHQNNYAYSSAFLHPISPCTICNTEYSKENTDEKRKKIMLYVFSVAENRVEGLTYNRVATCNY